MKNLKKSVAVKRISPAGEHFFFGYYDLQPFNKSETLHLTHKTSFRNKLQVKGDTAEIGVIDLKTDKYDTIDITNAWNFQQGAMLQWNPKAADREIIYNDMIDGELCGVVMDIFSGKKRFLEKPVANVSRDGKYAININMSRLYDFRPGYGYAWPRDPFYYKNHSTEDGVFITDMETGKAKLVLSLQEIWDFSGSFFKKDEKMIINHITFNPSGTRFLALVRNFPAPNQKHHTAMITANRDGSDMYLLSDYGIQSHYYWLNDEEVVVLSDGKELDCCAGCVNNYVFKDKTHQGYVQADGFWSDNDNHMSFTEDLSLMLTDCYPKGDDRMCVIQLYSPEKNICTDLGYFHSIPEIVTDVRCDLHPRFNRSGNQITFDSTHEGFRGIYKMDLTDDVIDQLFNE